MANKFTPGTIPRPEDLKKWKENFRNSLRSLGVKELVDYRNQDAERPFKVYQFIDEPGGVKKSRRKSQDSVRTASEINSSEGSDTASEGSNDGVLQENMSILNFRSRSPVHDFSDIETDGFSGDLNSPFIEQAPGHTFSTYNANALFLTSAAPCTNGAQNYNTAQSPNRTVLTTTQFTPGTLFCNNANSMNVTVAPDQHITVSSNAYTTAMPFAPNLLTNGHSLSANEYQYTASRSNGFILPTDTTLQTNILSNTTTVAANTSYQVYNNGDLDVLHLYTNGLNVHANGYNIPAANGFGPAPHTLTTSGAFNVDSILDPHNPRGSNITEYESVELDASLHPPRVTDTNKALMDYRNKLSENAASPNLPVFDKLTSMNSDSFPAFPEMERMSIDSSDLNPHNECRPLETANGENAENVSHCLAPAVCLLQQPSMKIKVNYYCFTTLTLDILDQSAKICYVPNDTFRDFSEQSPDSFGPVEPIVELPHVARCPELGPDQMKLIGAILENIKGGVRILYRDGDIYAKRFCKAVLHHSVPKVTPYKKLNRDKKYEKIFDFKDFIRNFSPDRKPYVQLSFSVKEPEKLQTQILSVQIWHLEASRIIQKAKASITSLCPYETECSLSNDFDRKLSIAEKMLHSGPA